MCCARIVFGEAELDVLGGALQEPSLDLSDLRGLQDWYLRYELTSLEGLSLLAIEGDPSVPTFGEIVEHEAGLRYDDQRTH